MGFTAELEAAFQTYILRANMEFVESGGREGRSIAGVDMALRNLRLSPWYEKTAGP